MITDARKLPSDLTIVCDVCVVGAGAAGITLAHELRTSGKQVVLLEGGGTRLESSAQDLYKGEVVDPERHGPLDQYRQRRFGGTTAVWGGRCAPFTAVDFEERPWVPYSGWPIHKRDLDSYYLRAHQYCDLGEYSYEVAAALPHQPSEMIPGFHSNDVCTDRLWRFSPPTHFGKTFIGALKQCRNISVYLHSNCLRIRLHKNGGSVDHLQVVSAGKIVSVKAQHYVLATGGLEATRLLLVSNDVHRGGIGNDRDLVGRFYLSHMTGDVGEVLFTPKGGHVLWNYERTNDGVYCRRTISIPEAKQREDQLLNFHAILSHPPIADPRHGNAILSAMYLIKRYLAHRIPPEYSKSLSGMMPVRRVLAHGGNVARDFANLRKFSTMWFRKRILSGRKLPSVVLESKSNIYTLHIDAEQSPNPDSRVSLSEEKDAFGINRLKVDWRFSELDVQSIVKSCYLIAHALEHSGSGKILFHLESLADRVRAECGVGSHHIGSTRMARLPSQGVVDENCRVHGVDNLYIASSSVFPTSGFANPTLTIVAMAIRLADHVRAC
jgi:choline dehydrogenase-like flavoprotein